MEPSERELPEEPGAPRLLVTPGDEKDNATSPPTPEDPSLAFQTTKRHQPRASMGHTSLHRGVLAGSRSWSSLPRLGTEPSSPSTQDPSQHSSSSAPTLLDPPRGRDMHPELLVQPAWRTHTAHPDGASQPRRPDFPRIASGQSGRSLVGAEETQLTSL